MAKKPKLSGYFLVMLAATSLMFRERIAVVFRSLSRMDVPGGVRDRIEVLVLWDSINLKLESTDHVGSVHPEGLPLPDALNAAKL